MNSNSAIYYINDSGEYKTNLMRTPKICTILALNQPETNNLLIPKSNFEIRCYWLYSRKTKYSVGFWQIYYFFSFLRQNSWTSPIRISHPLSSIVRKFPKNESPTLEILLTGFLFRICFSVGFLPLSTNLNKSW